jgi:hypothetical protein
VVNEIRRLMAMAEDEIHAAGLDRAAFLRGLLGLGALPLLTGDFATTPRGDASNAYATVIAGQRELYLR